MPCGGGALPISPCCSGRLPYTPCGPAPAPTPYPRGAPYPGGGMAYGFAPYIPGGPAPYIPCSCCSGGAPYIPGGCGGGGIPIMAMPAMPGGGNIASACAAACCCKVRPVALFTASCSLTRFAGMGSPFHCAIASSGTPAMPNMVSEMSSLSGKESGTSVTSILCTCRPWTATPGAEFSCLLHSGHLKCFARWCWISVSSSAKSLLQYQQNTRSVTGFFFFRPIFQQ